MQDELLLLEARKRWHARMADEAQAAIIRLISVRLKDDTGFRPQRKISEVIADEIRTLRSTGWVLKRLADRFQCGTSTVHRICRKQHND